jgi:hypothetical protein
MLLLLFATNDGSTSPPTPHATVARGGMVANVGGLMTR